MDARRGAVGPLPERDDHWLPPTRIDSSGVRDQNHSGHRIVSEVRSYLVFLEPLVKAGSEAGHQQELKATFVYFVSLVVENAATTKDTKVHEEL